MKLVSSCDVRKFDAALTEYAGLARKEVGAILRTEAAFITKKAIHLTPPFERWGSTDFSAQRKAGEGAIKSDHIKSLYPAEKMKIYDSENPRVRAEVRDAVKKGDPSRLAAVLKRYGWDIQQSDILDSASKDYFNPLRNPRGRLKLSSRKIIIKNSSIKKFLKECLANVGYLKSGWLAAVNRFSVTGIPSWIRRHSGDGNAIDGTQSASPFIEISNRVSYADSHNKGNRLVTSAIESSRIRLEQGIKRILKTSWRSK